MKLELLTAVMVYAFISSFSPCALQVAIALAAASTLAPRPANAQRASGAAFAAGLYLGYVAAGAAVLAAVSASLLLVQQLLPPVLLALAGVYALRAALPSRELKRLRLASIARAVSSPRAALALGVATGLAVFPCTGVPFVALLAAEGAEASLPERVLMLAVYSAIAVAPAAAVAVAAGRLRLARMVDRRLVDAATAALLAAAAFYVYAQP